MELGAFMQLCRSRSAAALVFVSLFGVLRPNLAEEERNPGLAGSNSTKKPMSTYESNVTLTLTLTPVNQQRALGLERSQLLCAREPPAGVNPRRSGGIYDPDRKSTRLNSSHSQ